ncbi:hypothetical protein L6164_016361 [Bauhinia variegata]|uniref:Uncharacterized protein n=1 Tax=Bauhinia variegata TaxID=167791 RepID=A0ACB9NNE9_BAUVA|nr:hypothetical protein L6164_016361 [Bauhinia variegata]
MINRMTAASASQFSDNFTALLPCSVKLLKRHSGDFRTLWQSVTPAAFIGSAISEVGEYDNSCIIEDKDLLRPSQNSKSGLHVLDLIDRGSIEVDRTLYNKLLKRCTQLGKLKEGKLVHSHILNSTFKDDLVIQNSILFMYTRCGSLDDARQMFDEMPSKDMVTWTSLITGYAQNERPEESLILFPQMLRHGLKPNEFTLSSLIKSSGLLPSYGDGRQIHACSLKYALIIDIFQGFYKYKLGLEAKVFSESI